VSSHGREVRQRCCSDRWWPCAQWSNCGGTRRERRSPSVFGGGTPFPYLTRWQLPTTQATDKSAL